VAQVVKRLKKPGFDLFHLPDIDFVLVTHAHFDHLDRRTLRKVAADQPIVVPTGVGNLVHDLGFNIVHELDQYQRVELGPLCVSLTPCHHWGARMLHDSHRGFGGFLIEAEGRSIFHCGDSAYFDGFAEIGKRFDIEIALLPIGAYDPPSGREVHMNPSKRCKPSASSARRRLCRCITEAFASAMNRSMNRRRGCWRARASMASRRRCWS
jgi:L-ascorbate metabolism protein UlaG (beta-lactamase superfamily)